MKTLYLVRHAKSSWNHPELADHERPLNKRGLRDAPMMAERLAAKAPRPEVIVSSPAVRAFTTARVMAQGISLPEKEIRVVQAIYDANVRDLLTVVHSLDDGVNTVLITGHNPGFTDFLHFLAPCNVDHVPTCAIAQLQHPGNTWSALDKDTCTLLDFDFPKRK